MRKGEYKDFVYRGSVEEFIIPNKGTYKLEVWGCHSGGSGGYSKGYKFFERGTKIYICCGGNPYNGGGSGAWGGLSGGGATHIALVTGTIQGIGKTNFDKYGLIVAGGGGGGWGGYDSNYGGSGGGTNGGGDTFGEAAAYGGTQTSGGGYNSAKSGGSSGAFGKGANGGRTGRYDEKDWACGGAGGGYYGGGAYYTNAYGGGAGGSGWIKNVNSFEGDNPTTQNGINKATGKARITLVDKISLALGDSDVDDIYLGDTPLGDLALGDVIL